MTGIFNDRNETAVEVNSHTQRALAEQWALYLAVPDKAAHPGNPYPEAEVSAEPEAPAENIETKTDEKPATTHHRAKAKTAKTESE